LEYYPSPEHRKAAEKFVETFRSDSSVLAILLVGSCARGKATKDSCLDLSVIVKNHDQVKPIIAKSRRACERIDEFKDLRRVGRFSQMDLNVTTGKFNPHERTWTSGPDDFELEIGNTFVYSVVLFERRNAMQNLQSRYLPYYSEELRLKRLEDVKRYMYNNLAHIPLYMPRGLYFASYSRLYNASKEFLQALFIKHRIYPIAYDKWIREQLVDILGQPGIYQSLVGLMQIKDFESTELAEKGEELKMMGKRYL
jgi:predicted nucleotidyltransferase